MATNPNYDLITYFNPQDHSLPRHEAIMVEDQVPYLEFTLTGAARGGIKLISTDGTAKEYMFVTTALNACTATGGGAGAKTTAGATAPLQVFRGNNGLEAAQNLATAIGLPGRGHGTTGADPKFRVSVYNSAGASALGTRGVIRIHQAVAGEGGLTNVTITSLGPTADNGPAATVFEYAPQKSANAKSHNLGDEAIAELIGWGGAVKRGGNGRIYEGGTGPTTVIRGISYANRNTHHDSNLGTSHKILPFTIKGLGEVRGFNVYGLN